MSHIRRKRAADSWPATITFPASAPGTIRGYRQRFRIAGELYWVVCEWYREGASPLPASQGEPDPAHPGEWLATWLVRARDGAIILPASCAASPGREAHPRCRTQTSSRA